MQEAGVNLVSVGIFSWALLEPERRPCTSSAGWTGSWTCSTATGSVWIWRTRRASPPPWFSRKYPESLPVTADGVRHSYGSRQAFAPLSPTTAGRPPP